MVLPGRKRESWMLNVLLDTSGSMTDEIPRALGAIAEFCDAMGVDCIRVVQCDTEITADAIVTPDELATFEVSGFGGSDLTPAMLALADDPRVTAAVIVTDGDIEYPREEMPYQRALGAAGARQLCSALWRGGQHGGRSAMKAVQELVSYFDRRGKLSERQIRKLLDGGFLAADAPVNMVDLCRRYRRDVLFPGVRQDRRADLGHRHLCRRLGAGDRRRACRPGQARRDRVHQGDGRPAADAVSRLGAQRRHQQQFRPLRQGLPPVGDQDAERRSSPAAGARIARRLRRPGSQRDSFMPYHVTLRGAGGARRSALRAAASSRRRLFRFSRHLMHLQPLGVMTLTK